MDSYTPFSTCYEWILGILGYRSPQFQIQEVQWKELREWNRWVIKTDQPCFKCLVAKCYINKWEKRKCSFPKWTESYNSTITLLSTASGRTVLVSSSGPTGQIPGLSAPRHPWSLWSSCLNSMGLKTVCKGLHSTRGGREVLPSRIYFTYVQNLQTQ